MILVGNLVEDKLQKDIKVKFQGTEYWLLCVGEFSGGGRAIAPLRHCDDEGHPLPCSVFEDSFAHLCSDGCIRRYGKVIGTQLDLELI